MVYNSLQLWAKLHKQLLHLHKIKNSPVYTSPGSCLFSGREEGKEEWLSWELLLNFFLVLLFLEIWEGSLMEVWWDAVEAVLCTHLGRCVLEKKNANMMGLPIWLDITYKTQAEYQAIVFSPGKLILWFSYYNSSFQVSRANAIRPVLWNVSWGANPSVILGI